MFGTETTQPLSLSGWEGRLAPPVLLKCALASFFFQKLKLIVLEEAGAEPPFPT